MAAWLANDAALAGSALNLDLGGGKRDADTAWVRPVLRMPATDPDAAGAECPPQSRRRSCRARPAGYRSARSDPRYRDGFGNWCNRIIAPTGQIRLSASGVINDRGQPDILLTDAQPCADNRFLHGISDSCTRMTRFRVPLNTVPYITLRSYIERAKVTQRRVGEIRHTDP